MVGATLGSCHLDSVNEGLRGLVVGGQLEHEILHRTQGLADVLDTLNYGSLVVRVSKVRWCRDDRGETGVDGHSAARSLTPTEVLAHDHGSYVTLVLFKYDIS